MITELLLDDAPQSRCFSPQRIDDDSRKALARPLLRVWKQKKSRLASLLHPHDFAHLAATYRASRRRNLAIVRIMRRWAGLLEAAGVRAVVLKGGAALLQAYRGDLGARPLRDLDILVDETQLRRARAAIQAAGFKEIYGVFQDKYLTPSQLRETLFNADQTIYRDGDIDVELHWFHRDARSHDSRLSARIFDEARSVKIAGRPAWTACGAPNAAAIVLNMGRDFIDGPIRRADSSRLMAAAACALELCRCGIPAEELAAEIVRSDSQFILASLVLLAGRLCGTPFLHLRALPLRLRAPLRLLSWRIGSPPPGKKIVLAGPRHGFPTRIFKNFRIRGETPAPSWKKNARWGRRRIPCA